MKLAAIGTLPGELIDAIRGGSVTATEAAGTELLFRDGPTGRAWRVDLEANSAAPLTFLHARSGPAPVSAPVPRIAAARATSVSPAGPAPAAEAEPLALPELLARHRALAEAVAHFLAPAPRAPRELTRAFASSGGGGDAAALAAVLAALSTTNRRGERELAADGYALVDIDAFPSKSERLRVANLALTKVAHDKALVDRFSLHADRDVMLAACSRGIMAGLGSAKRARSGADDDEDDEDEAEKRRAQQQEQKQQQQQQQQPAALFVSMDQSGIRWADGDLRAEPWVMPSAAKEALDALRRPAGESLIAPMRITTAAQLASARGRYAVLLREYGVVRGHLQRFEDITGAARQWADGSGARFAPELRTELRKWFDEQEAPRKSLVVALGILHKALYEVKREIEDYVNLREWGVLME